MPAAKTFPIVFPIGVTLNVKKVSGLYTVWQGKSN